MLTVSTWTPASAQLCNSEGRATRNRQVGFFRSFDAKKAHLAKGRLEDDYRGSEAHVKPNSRSVPSAGWNDQGEPPWVNARGGNAPRVELERAEERVQTGRQQRGRQQRGSGEWVQQQVPEAGVCALVSLQ
jgi:hypothetical protein